MRCVFQTNPCKSPQDDYVWYRLADDHWEVEPNSGNTPQFSDAVVIPRAFSTIRGGSSFLVLLRDKGMLSLCVDAPTLREEVGQHRRPIKDTLYLQAENSEDEYALCGFVERCLSVDDAEGLGNPGSEVGEAVDNIWATASLKNFMAKFGVDMAEQGCELVGSESWVYPRQDLVARCAFVQKVRSAVAGPRPFLVALTDRTPSEALSELRSFVGSFVVFSSRITSAQKDFCSDFRPRPSSKAKVLMIGGLAAVLAAASATFALYCWKKGEKPSNGLRIAETNSCARLQEKHIPCETNSPVLRDSAVMTNEFFEAAFE